MPISGNNTVQYQRICVQQNLSFAPATVPSHEGLLIGGNVLPLALFYAAAEPATKKKEAGDISLSAYLSYL